MSKLRKSLITLLTLGFLVGGIVAAVLDENIGFEDTGELLGSVGLSLFSILGSLFTASIFLSAVTELKQCTKGSNNLPKPNHELLRYDPYDLPYAVPKNYFESFWDMIMMPFKMILGFFGYKTRPDRRVSFMYQKTNNIISDHSADTFIGSWSYMREILYTMIVYIYSWYPIKEKLIEADEAEKAGKVDDSKNTGKKGYLSSFIRSVQGILVIWISGHGIWIMSLIAAIAGYFGLLSSSIAGPAKLIAYILIPAFAIIGIFVSFLQYIHNIYLFYSSTLRPLKDENSKHGFHKILYFLYDKFYFAILISLILLSTRKWIIQESGDVSMWALDIGITYLVMGIVYFIVRKLGKVDMTKVMKEL